jgi:hypothetical protein
MYLLVYYYSQTEHLLVKIYVLKAASIKMTVFWDIAPCSLAVMEAVRTSETSVSFYENTRFSIP